MVVKLRLNELLDDRAMSKNKAARLAGFDPHLFGKWTRNTHMPRLDSFVQLAEFFDCDMRDLIEIVDR